MRFFRFLVKCFKFLGITIVLLILLGWILTSLPIDFSETKTVSIISLIANSWPYHGKKVQTRGFLQLDFENFQLHLDRESYEQKLNNYIWISLDEKQMFDYKSLEKHYVVVEGTFDATIGRTSFQGIGSIRKVKRVQRIDLINRP